MTEKRPVAQVNTSAPGSDVAAETAAALASASLVFRSSDSTYSSSLLKHAQQLFNFADKNRGSYSMSIPQVQTYYNSTGYGDELLWAAGWLYHATGDKSYIEYVTGQNGESFARWGNPTWFSWDDKLPGVHVYFYLISQNAFGAFICCLATSLKLLLAPPLYILISFIFSIANNLLMRYSFTKIK